MLVTDDSAGFIKAWEGSTPPQLNTTEQVTRGKPVEAMLIFSGCRAGADGQCNVSVDLSVVGPDGSPYGESMHGPIWRGPPAPQYNLQLGESGLGFILDPHDKLGVYTLKAKVTDQVAARSVEVEQTITATEPE